ncbi:DUF5672 family protein [Olivibacter domesticus]|uniref:DUF5672 domain-containing protein n=1 Tax=Olivibacter domesticus TaxID=407022 RepID=A0A1H7VHG8_OLID1|nr:DUF5672 family protein [Olivibacter domesticus]SEM08590.1 hypothetical protein SAMN05661044_04187 [Olivibacter domesticus]
MSVAIVIPVYKELADSDEKYSFWQCTEILHNYPIILVAPTSLNTSYYEALTDKPLKIKRFDDAFFKGVSGYSKLLTSRFFYQSFANYDYILLYQLDAWVFQDDLLNWTEQGYDYIGAPWLEAPPITSGKKPIINLSKKLVNKVGNGGLSLRKVNSHIRWSNWVSLLFKFLPKNEDLLWTLFVPFKKPSAKEALLFAFERNPAQSFELTQHRLPFGCHAWQKYQPEFWRKYIVKY